MTAFEVALLAATVLCTLTAGLVFAFAVVVMPGIRALPDRDFLRAFQVMDHVIQTNEPRFLAVWVGSVGALLAAVALGFGTLDGVEQAGLIGVATAYLLGVQLPTIACHLPLNRRIQELDLDGLDASALAAEREAFEGRWNYWNAVRTGGACLSAVGLVVVVAGV